jgi:hypothetical protein
MQTTRAALAFLALIAPPVLAQTPPASPQFDVASFASSKPNAFFPLEPGIVRTTIGTLTEAGLAAVAEDDAADGDSADEADPDEAESAIPYEQDVVTVLGKGPVLMGVQTTTVLDEAFAEGRIVERTFDYFAADKDGNVWYFGEDVTNFVYDEEDRLTGTNTDGTWRSGVNGAVPGIVMAAEPVVGLSLFPEVAPVDDAMDYFTVIATDLTLTGLAGTFTGVLKTFEGNTLEPDDREFKYWAPGLGIVRVEEGLSENLDTPEMIVELQP